MTTLSTARLTRLLLATATCFATSAPSLRAENSLHVKDMVVVLIDSVEVAATETGVIAELNVREGNAVKIGQELGKLDDRKARLQEKLAATQLKIATAKAENGLATDLAEKKLAHQHQLVKQHDVVRTIADKKAENETRVLASKKAEEVAKNELGRANRARREFADSVSQSEIDGLQLAYERSKLETQQANFERQIDRLNVRTELEAATALGLSVDQSEIQLAQAVADQQIEQLQNLLQQNQLELAQFTVSQHTILSPIDGVVVERIRRPGDWVQSGDPVVRVVRLNRLRAEGFVDAGKIDMLRGNRVVSLVAEAGDANAVTRSGKIVFISPEIDPVNNEARFWVEFENPSLNILPGMRVSMDVTSP